MASMVGEMVSGLGSWLQAEEMALGLGKWL